MRQVLSVRSNFLSFFKSYNFYATGLGLLLHPNRQSRADRSSPDGKLNGRDQQKSRDATLELHHREIRGDSRSMQSGSPVTRGPMLMAQRFYLERAIREHVRSERWIYRAKVSSCMHKKSKQNMRGVMY